MVLRNPLKGIADEPDVPVSKIVEAAEIIEHFARLVSAEGLIVKSRRAASSLQSSVNATVARRPSVDTSRRRVVISNG